MIVLLQVRNEGPLDTNRKVGDLVSVYDDSFEASIGNQEKKSHLAVKFPDPTLPNGSPYPAAYLTQLRADLVKQEWAPGPTPETNEVRHERRHSIPFFRSRLSVSELTIVDDGAQMLPDGATSQGGSVTSGVVSGLFAFGDIVRK